MQIVIDKSLINYFEVGNGQRPIMLLHGWGTNASTFLKIANQIQKENYKLYLIDLPGFGKSNFPNKSMDITSYAEVIKKFIKKKRIDKPIILGHSFGGRILIKLAANNPELLSNKIILIDSAGVVLRNKIKNLILMVVAKTGKLALSIPVLNKFKKKAKDKLYQKIGAEDYKNSGQLKETFKKIISEDLSFDAGRIKTKTLIIWGSKDKETPKTDGEKLSSLISNSKLKVIESAGHFPYIDQPQQTIQIINEFLNE